LAATLQRRTPSTITSAASQQKALNAESVTAIATSFLKRIGNKGNLKPKRVSLEEGIYSVEVEMKKFTAIVQVDAENHEIKEYEIQSKGEESPMISISPKTLLTIFGISAVTFVILYFVFKTVGI